jgi:DNA invertase Pin-like site-specific DNA recombinase
MCDECFSLALSVVLQPVGRPVSITAEQTAEVIALREQGLTYKAIARKTRMSYAAVYRICKRGDVQ